ncbi:hypothetical protein [Hyphomonas sp.]|uniref:hypothetical protein n=1 Tax=Hyphomonas sp. TaxID=87 RepID=UPI0039194FEE
MRAGRPGLAAAGLLAAACACIPPAEDIAAACPAVRSAEAWINRMPSTTAREPALVVMVRVDSAEPWSLKSVGAPQPGDPLRLELTEGGHGHPGIASWRRTGRETPGSIEIFCGENLHHRITEITSAR